MVALPKEEIRQAQEKIAKEGKRSKKKTEETAAPKKDSETEKAGLERLSSDKDDFLRRNSALKETQPPIKELENLEEALSKEKIPSFVKESEYTRELSREPVQVLYDQAKALASQAEEKGYLSATEQRQMQYIAGAIEEKVDGGEYSFTEETAKKASLILELASESKQLYKGTGSNQKSWYKSG
ncbi:hypothetical protein J4479_00495 [Candidatus Woesearchaeota archaeon]|nr:hypothetical protein [Candidatus Woesearchaeota archaeon]